MTCTGFCTGCGCQCTKAALAQAAQTIERKDREISKLTEERDAGAFFHGRAIAEIAELTRQNEIMRKAIKEHLPLPHNRDTHQWNCDCRAPEETLSHKCTCWPVLTMQALENTTGKGEKG